MLVAGNDEEMVIVPKLPNIEPGSPKWFGEPDYQRLTSHLNDLDALEGQVSLAGANRTS